MLWDPAATNLFPMQKMQVAVVQTMQVTFVAIYHDEFVLNYCYCWPALLCLANFLSSLALGKTVLSRNRKQAILSRVLKKLVKSRAMQTGVDDRHYDHSQLSAVLSSLNARKVANKHIVVCCTVMPGYCRCLRPFRARCKLICMLFLKDCSCTMTPKSFMLFLLSIHPPVLVCL